MLQKLRLGLRYHLFKLIAVVEGLATIHWLRFWISIFIFVPKLLIADQIVYLDRFGLNLADRPTLMFEPIFNPKSITANVGERITFMTRLYDISSINVCPCVNTDTLLTSFLLDVLTIPVGFRRSIL